MVERGGGLKAAYVAEEWAVREASPQLDSAASTVRPAVTLGPVSRRSNRWAGWESSARDAIRAPVRAPACLVAARPSQSMEGAQRRQQGQRGPGAKEKSRFRGRTRPFQGVRLPLAQ